MDGHVLTAAVGSFSTTLAAAIFLTTPQMPSRLPTVQSESIESTQTKLRSPCEYHIVYEFLLQLRPLRADLMKITVEAAFHDNGAQCYVDQNMVIKSSLSTDCIKQTSMSDVNALTD